MTCDMGAGAQYITYHTWDGTYHMTYHTGSRVYHMTYDTRDGRSYMI